MNRKIRLAAPDEISALTAITPLELESLTNKGFLTRRFDFITASFLYPLKDTLETVDNFDKLLVTRKILDAPDASPLSYPVINTRYPDSGDIKPAGYEWESGQPLFRFSDILNWRKLHRNSVKQTQPQSSLPKTNFEKEALAEIEQLLIDLFPAREDGKS